MSVAKWFFVLSAFNGLLAVALGAFGAHALKAKLTAAMLGVWQTAVQYQMYHALALFGVGLLAMHFPGNTLLRVSGYLFVLGIIFFSGSLYALSLSGVRWLGAITPIGGVLFLAGWAALAWAMFSARTF